LSTLSWFSFLGVHSLRLSLSLSLSFYIHIYLSIYGPLTNPTQPNPHSTNNHQPTSTNKTGGKLKDYTASELGAFASKAALADVGKNVPIDSVIVGNVAHTDAAGPYLARHVGLRTGLDITVPALTVNRLCGSGFQSIINAAHEIIAGDANIVLTGGAESMSLAPYALRGIRFGGTRFGVDLKLEDTLAAALVDRFPKETPMGITAENLAQQHNISRQDCDEYALLSQQRWAAGKFSSFVPLFYILQGCLFFSLLLRPCTFWCISQSFLSLWFKFYPVKVNKVLQKGGRRNVICTITINPPSPAKKTRSH
jgi:hypothetical protein